MTQQTTAYAPRKGETFGLWFIKIITGPLLIILLIAHMIVNHLIAEGGLLTYADVIAYFSNPWIVIMEITFLITVTTHAFLGLRGIILDMNPSRRILKEINWVLGLAGVVFVVYGVWLAMTVASQGM
ncbi:MAG: succinate dehydrogenase/fumarate reductase transmembrane subunit [Bellilinea sp.]